MKSFCLSVAILFVSLSEWVHAEKLTIAHVAINPSQGMFWVAKDSGILAKYGFTADIVLIPGTPRTVQALIAGDVDYAAVGSNRRAEISESRIFSKHYIFGRAKEQRFH
jgi:ABC-type nitrate/sulfonate/bicarbonate transport system substrate-binding protein